MTAPSVVHSTFVIERTYGAPPARVFAAFSDEKTKRRWFAEGEGWQVHEFRADFRVGGGEWSRFRFKDGPEARNDTVYHDIVSDRRIVLGYTMTVGEQRISASLVTVELLPSGEGTRVVFTEQAAFFEGADGAKVREQGWRTLLGRLEEELRAAR
jgi:uncharacterized protein YndB with AHSA1/START domain